MDQKGFLATTDAIFGLLIIFILISSVLNVNNIPNSSFSQEIGPQHDIQDIMENMASSAINDDNETILSKISIQLMSNNNSKESIESSGIIAAEFLNKTAPGMKYNFTETRQLNGTTIVANSPMENTKNIQSAARHFGNYTFQLYVWS